MIDFSRRRTASMLALLLAGSTGVLADGGLTITLRNDSGDNLLVTVYDQVTKPASTVLSNREIYGDASVSINLTAGGSGHGHLTWSAVTVDHDMRKCGRGEQRHLNDGDTVAVHADGACHTP